MSNLRHCRRRNEAMADKYCKFGFIYQVRFEHVVQGAKKISYDSLSALKIFCNEIILHQRTIIHIFLQYEGNFWNL